VIVYNAILCCDRDNALAAGHIAQLDSLGQPMTHCLYYGLGSSPVADIPHHTVGLLEMYDNVTLKTYCAMKHALSLDMAWDVLLKTDVTSRVVRIDWGLVAAHDLVAYVSPVGPFGTTVMPRDYNKERYAQPAFAEPWPGRPPKTMIGGTAYTVSRRLAELIVQRGIWYCAGWKGEDVMVAQIAEENGITPVDGTFCEVSPCPS